MDIISLILMQKGLKVGTGASEIQINECETALELNFADDYKEYLRKFGNVSYYLHELTGITIDDRLNVVRITNDDKEYIKCIPRNMYVVEEAYIDDIVYLQDETGKIYISKNRSMPVLVYDSLYEYICNT